VLAVPQNHLAAQFGFSDRHNFRSRCTLAVNLRRHSLKVRRSTCDCLPGISIGQASQLLQEQDRIIRTFPEVESVFGSVGRSDSATDNAPLDMYDTTLMLKPRSQWRPGMTYEKLIQEIGREAPVSWAVQHLDDASRKPSRYGN